MKISWYNILTKKSIRRFGKFSNKKNDQEIQDTYIDEEYNKEEEELADIIKNDEMYNLENMLD